MIPAKEWAARFDFSGDPRPFEEVIADIQADARREALLEAERLCAEERELWADDKGYLAAEECRLAIRGLIEKG